MQITLFPPWSSPLAGAVEVLFLQLPAWESSPDSDPLLAAQENARAARRILLTLRDLIEEHEFATRPEEIVFFKEVKPLFSGSLIYWNRRFHMDLQRPVGGRGIIRKYWKKRLHDLSRFFREHTGFYEYLRAGDTRMDELYFLRTRADEQESRVFPDLNPRFTTPKGHLPGKILACDRLEQYILRLLNAGKQEAARVPKIQWTASKANLVELIYALQSGGVCNNGSSGIKEMAEGFQQFFQVDLGNYYHVFNEIRLRKKNRTSLLDQLREKVLQKMDGLDER